MWDFHLPSRGPFLDVVEMRLEIGVGIRVRNFGVYFEIVGKKWYHDFWACKICYIVYEKEEKNWSKDASLRNSAGYRDGVDDWEPIFTVCVRCERKSLIHDKRVPLIP